MPSTNKITIHLYQDWVDTAREVFRGSGHPLESHLDDAEIAYQYYRLQTDTEEDARLMAEENKQRLNHLEQTVLEHLDTVIIPDIRQRTGYSGEQFIFRWIYAQGEHIVEECSEYRIPLPS